jgi:hypothetical protein
MSFLRTALIQLINTHQTKSHSDSENDSQEEDDHKSFLDAWIAAQIQQLKLKFHASSLSISINDVFIKLFHFYISLNNNKKIYKSKIVTLSDLLATSSSTNVSNVFGDVLICRIVPTSLANNISNSNTKDISINKSSTSSSSSSSSSSISKRKKRTLSLLAIDNTGQIPCIVTDPDPELLQGIYYFTKWKLVRAHKPKMEIHGCAEGTIIFRYLEIDTLSVINPASTSTSKASSSSATSSTSTSTFTHSSSTILNSFHRLVYYSPPPRILSCILSNHSKLTSTNSTNSTTSTTSTVSTTEQQLLLNIKHYIRSKALTIDHLAQLNSNQRRKSGHIVIGRLISVSPLYQRPKDRTKSCCFFDISSTNR